MCVAMFESRRSLLGRITIIMENSVYRYKRIHWVFDVLELG